MSESNLLNKHHKHSHFWIENEYLNESYHTIRGLRYMTICKAVGFDDDDCCSDEKAEYIIRENK